MEIISSIIFPTEKTSIFDSSFIDFVGNYSRYNKSFSSGGE